MVTLFMTIPLRISAMKGATTGDGPNHSVPSRFAVPDRFMCRGPLRDLGSLIFLRSGIAHDVPEHGRGTPARVRGIPDRAPDIPDRAPDIPEHDRGYPARVRGIPEHDRGYPARVRDIPEHGRGYPARVRGIPEHDRDTRRSLAASPSAIAASPSAIAASPSAIAASPSAIATAPSAITASPSAIAVGRGDGRLGPRLAAPGQAGVPACARAHSRIAPGHWEPRRLPSASRARRRIPPLGVGPCPRKRRSPLATRHSTA